MFSFILYFAKKFRYANSKELEKVNSLVQRALYYIYWVIRFRFSFRL